MPLPGCAFLDAYCSTIVGDIAEVKAIKKAFTNTSHMKMNATKSMIGHCLGAAAGIEAVAVVKAIQTGWVHPTLNQYNLVEECGGYRHRAFREKQHKVSSFKAGPGCLGAGIGRVILLMNGNGGGAWNLYPVWSLRLPFLLEDLKNLKPFKPQLLVHLPVVSCQ